MDSFTLDKVEFDEVRRILSGFCSCSLGRQLALRITPSRNPEIIRRWLDQTTQMVRALRDTGLPPLAGAADVGGALHRTTPGGGATGEDFAAVASTLEAAENVRGFLVKLPEDLTLLLEFTEGLPDFAREIEAIRRVVGPDGAILDDASPRLFQTRREIETVTQRIHDVMYSYARRPEVGKLLQNPTVTLHGDRFVLPVKSENRGRLPGVVHRASNTGATVFVEPEASVELNNRLNDLYGDERLEIQRLLSELALRVHARSEDIAKALRTLAQVDMLSAKAQYAYQFDMTCPEVHEHGPLQFDDARHPLLVDQVWRQEKQGVPPDKRHTVVPISVRLGQDFDLLVITGSNTGGKTVALKTVALLVLMAQAGMHIPVRRGARMPTFGDVLIDIGDEQSLEQSLSTFGGHIKRIRYILQKADKASLVLLDELGSGTDPDEGGAIGQAVLDELRQTGCVGMITTHLSILKAYAFNHERVDNASVEFDTVTLSPTYHLRLGTPGESHAITVAQKLGMPKRIMSMARRHLSEQGKQFAKAIQATTQARESAEVARRDARDAQLAATTEQEAYQAKLADVQRLQEEFEHWLATLPELTEGDEVFVPSLQKAGRLIRLELHRQVALVAADAVQVEVPLRDLMPDLGQQEVRRQIADLRRQITEQSRQAQTARVEAQRLQQEFHQSIERQKAQAKQFDRWLGHIGRVKVGDEVPIAVKPGHGIVVELDFKALTAVVRTGDGKDEKLSIQDLFPQTGPFAHIPREAHEGAQRGHGKGKGRPGAPHHGRTPEQAHRGEHAPQGEHGPKGEHAPHQGKGRHAPGEGTGGHGPREDKQKDRPVPHRHPNSRSARENRDALLALQPGQPVFVVPFNQQATLIRFADDKSQATVQAGIFEMRVSVADLELVKDTAGQAGQAK